MMKNSIFSVVFLMLLMSPTFASWNEVECDGLSDNKFIKLEIESPFPRNSYFREATLYISDNADQDSSEENETLYYTVYPRFNPTFGRYEYFAAGMRLEVDVWPDSRPRWGWTYTGLLSSGDFRDWSKISLDCQFPNAF